MFVVDNDNDLYQNVQVYPLAAEVFVPYDYSEPWESIWIVPGTVPGIDLP